MHCLIGPPFVCVCRHYRCRRCCCYCRSIPTGQPVETCDTQKFCRPIPNNNRFLCQYSFRPEGSLCRLGNSNNAVSAAGLPDSDNLSELSAEEIQTLGLQAQPSSADANHPEGEEGAHTVVHVSGGVETQQTVRASKVLTCGQCRANVCVEASRKWCKSASKRADSTV
jgi:hypothetical protein